VNRRDFLKLAGATVALVTVPVKAAPLILPVSPIIASPKRQLLSWSIRWERELQRHSYIGGGENFVQGISRTIVDWEEYVDGVIPVDLDEYITVKDFAEAGVKFPCKYDELPQARFLVVDMQLYAPANRPITAKYKAFEVWTPPQ